MTVPLPRLLVSVRSPHEALAAIRGGAQLVDVKEPSRGALGRADERIVAEIVAAVRSEAPEVPISVALGETVEMSNASDASIPAGVTFAKLGLAGLSQRPDGGLADWQAARQAVEERSQSPLQWVAVIYADGSGCPPAADIIQAARETNCAGVLIDTYDKQSGGLLTHVDVRQLTDLAAQCRRSQMFFAMAGRLSRNDLASLPEAAPDIVAVRSAVCEGSDRSLTVSQSRTRELRNAIADRFTTDRVSLASAIH